MTRWSRLMFRLVAMLAFAGLLAGASCGEEKKDAKADEPAEAADKKDDKKDGEQGSAAKPADGKADAAANRYPPFNLEKLKPELRERMYKLAEAELCPCEGSTDSLDACLKKEDGGCMVAIQAGGRLAGNLQKGLSDTDAINDVTKYVKAMKATYEFDLKNVPVKGSKDAKVVLVEFADFGCPHCRQAAGVMDKVTAKYGDKIAFHYMQYPLREQTAPLSLAALAAHEQGRFWEMHDLLFKNQGTVDMPKLTTFARQLGMNADKFNKDMFSDQLKAEVTRQRGEGEKAKVSGTPALFINGKQFFGEKTLETVSAAIDKQLAADAPKK